MKLRDILEGIIGEEAETVSFPGENFNALFDEVQRKIVFSPIKPGSHSTKVRTFVNLLKQNFNVQSVEPKEGNTFEVKMSPTEDFNLVKDFILQQTQET